MKKQGKQKDDNQVSLKDTLDSSLLQKLKETKKQLEQQEQKQKEEEVKRKREEKRLREKNKSFEELLAESNLDWRKFK